MKKYLIGGCCVAAALLAFVLYRTASVPSVPLDAAAVPTYGYSCLCKVIGNGLIVPKPESGICGSLDGQMADTWVEDHLDPDGGNYSCYPAEAYLVECREDFGHPYQCLCNTGGDEIAYDFPDGTSTSDAQSKCEELDEKECGY